MKSNANGLMGDLESIKALLEEDGDLPSWDIATEPVQEVSFDAPTTAESSSADQPIDTFPPEDLNRGPDFSDDFPEDFADVLDDNVPEDLAFEAELLNDELPTLTDALSAAPVVNTEATTASLNALLGADFHNATASVMARARGLIEQHPNEWSPQQTDELSDALRVRIDGAVQEWISASLSAHAGELQQRLLNAVRDELARHLEAFEIADDSNQP